MCMYSLTCSERVTRERGGDVGLTPPPCLQLLPSKNNYLTRMHPTLLFVEIAANCWFFGNHVLYLVGRHLKMSDERGVHQRV